MKKTNKKILSQINLYAEGWTQNEISEKKLLKSTFYNANYILVCPLHKPISKIINLNAK
jgi:hypothetical protein